MFFLYSHIAVKKGPIMDTPERSFLSLKDIQALFFF